jgi:hypothetical protein
VRAAPPEATAAACAKKRLAKKIFKIFHPHFYRGFAGFRGRRGRSTQVFLKSVFYIGISSTDGCDRQTSFARKELRGRVSNASVDTKARVIAERDRVTRHLRRETVIIARQQKGHDGFFTSSQMLAADVGGRWRPTFFHAASPHSRTTEANALNLRAAFRLSCVIFKSRCPRNPNPVSPNNSGRRETGFSFNGGKGILHNE